MNGNTILRTALLLLAVLLLSACAASRPAFDATRNWTLVCYPGSAIKRKVPDGSAYPDWMIQERGSCLHR